MGNHFASELVKKEFSSLLEIAGNREVLFPKSAQDVTSIVRVANEHALLIQFYSSEESVNSSSIVQKNVESESSDDRTIYVNFSDMNRVLELDQTSRFVHVQAGVTFKQLEQALFSHQLTLDFPEDAALMNAQVGPSIISGVLPIERNENDPVDQMVAGLEAVFPNGEWVRIRPAPRRAVGPDMVSMFWGSQGAMGLVVSAYLLVKPRLRRQKLGFQFDDLISAQQSLAWVRGHGVRPSKAIILEHEEKMLLCLELPAEGLLAQPFEEVTRDVVQNRGGMEINLENLTRLHAHVFEPSGKDFSIETIAKSFDFHPTKFFNQRF